MNHITPLLTNFGKSILNYYCNFIPSFENLKLGLRPKSDWNKVYIDLAPEISVSQLEQYRVFFSVQYSGSGGEVQKVYIDNVKLIHF